MGERAGTGTISVQLKQTQSDAFTKLNGSQQAHSDAIQLAKRNSQLTMDRACESASWETEPTGTYWGKSYDGNACKIGSADSSARDRDNGAFGLLL